MTGRLEEASAVSPTAVDRLLTVSQTASALGCSDQKVRSLLARGELEGTAELINTNQRWAVSEASVLRLLSRQAEREVRSRRLDGRDDRAKRTPLAPTPRSLESGPGGVGSLSAVDLLALQVQQLHARAELAEARATDAEQEASRQAARAATLEAALSFQTAAKEELLAAFEAGLDAQRRLSQMAVAERQTVDQFLHAVPVNG